MKITSITPRNFGPFFGDAITIEIERDITVLTGANDAGKTSLLRLIGLAFENNGSYQAATLDPCLNLDYAQTAHKTWQSSEEFGCSLTLQGTALSAPINKAFEADNIATVRCNLPPGQIPSLITEFTTPTGVNSKSNAGFSRRPRTVNLPFSDRIEDRLDTQSSQPATLSLLRAAFGQSYSSNTFARATDSTFDTLITNGQDQLNENLKRILPPSVDVSIRLEKVDGRFLKIAIRDRGGSLTPITRRGNGLQAIFRHLAGLLDAASNDQQHIVILFDEPEASLHADLQHLLRRFLEQTAKLPHIQVIYATHSPSMINTRRPHTVRVLKRTHDENRSAVQIQPRTLRRNWLPVREGLGLTPADSLLYGDITVVAEGPTESICLPAVLYKLADAGVIGFADKHTALDQVHFLPGEGDSLPFFVTLAKSQGNRVIAFLDGDNPRVIERLTRGHPDVLQVRLPEGQEIEDVVPPDSYIAALAKILRPSLGPVAEITLEAFKEWLGKGDAPGAFSKKVKAWVNANWPDAAYDKPDVLLRAIEDTAPDKLAPTSAPLQQLVDTIAQVALESH